MRSFKHLPAALALVAVVALAGCTVTPEATPPQPSAASTALPEPAGRSPLDLIGLWTVTEADGAQPETWISFSDRWLTIWSPCASVNGSWVSDGARLRARVSNGFGPCITTSMEPEPWFTAIRDFEITDDGTVRLLSEAGEKVALLTPAFAPTPFDFGENGLQQAEVPVVTDDMLEAAAQPTALDAALVPADDSMLVGHWTLADYDGVGTPDAVFDADGTYHATDGCNSVGGPYLVNEGGRFRAGPWGVMTGMGCDNVDLPEWIKSAARVGIDPKTEELVLVDHDGAELARLKSKA